jgi:hypothetical protein
MTDRKSVVLRAAKRVVTITRELGYAQAHQEAEELAALIRHEVDTRSGRLASTVGVDGDRSSFRIVVRAGGKATTTVSQDGRSYDYALSEEFGTTKRPASPFFFNTWKRNRAKFILGVRGRVARGLGRRSA